MRGFTSCRFEIGETAVTIAGDSRHIPSATGAIAAARRAIERQIAADPHFLTTFEPYDHRCATNDIARRMCEAASIAGVGPMATVAGTVAQAALEAMAGDGCDHGWVDNGGDVALTLSRPTTVEVFCGSDSMEAFGLEVEPTDGIIGICSSSGKLGHSISLGAADVCVAIAESAILADAFATAICNRVGSPDDLETCFDPFTDADGFIGAIAVLDGRTAITGSVPRIVEAEHNPDKITAHSRMPSRAFAVCGQGRDMVDREVIP
jgi:ApbE superfamily uncharacterized protein (UPF0280 family)